MQTSVLDQDGKVYSNFIESCKSEGTKKTYKQCLENFMDFCKTDKMSDLISLSQELIHESIRGFIIHLKQKNSATSTIKIHLSALKSFYEMNDIEGIRWKRLSKYRGEDTPEHEDKAYEYEQIQKLLEISDQRLKVSILLMASSGMRVGALPIIKLSHIKKMVDCYKISVYKGEKGKGKYYTFCTPECAKAIDTYLEYRTRCGEKLNDDSPLLRNEFDSNLSVKVKKPIPLAYDALRRDIDRRLVMAGIKEIDHVNPFKRKDVKMTHGFRKFFKSKLVRSKVDHDIRKLLMGHSKKDLDLVYDRLTDQEVFEEFSKAIDLLTINPENRLRRQVEFLTVEKSKMDLLEEKVNNLINSVHNPS